MGAKQLIPVSHVDILMEQTRAVLSTLDDAGVFSGYCWIQMVDGVVFLDSVDTEQSKHVVSSDKVSILVVDPVNIDR